MGFLKRLFGGGDDGGATDGGASDESEWMQAHEATFESYPDKHRVTFWMRLYDPDFETMREQQKVFALENTLMRALDEAGAGEHDTNSLEKGYMAMRMVGEDADAIVAVLLPLLAEAPEGSYLALRRGPSGTGEDRLEVGIGADGADEADES